MMTSSSESHADSTVVSKKTYVTRRRIILSSIIAVLILCLGVDLYVSNNSIAVSSHTLESDKIEDPVRIAVVSDLHCKEFHNNNEDLFEKISEQSPDIILAVGDMITKRNYEDKDIAYLREVVTDLCTLAPVYYSLGNQERQNPELESIKTAVTESGATLLDLEYTDITVNGNVIRIGGLSYYRNWDEESNNFLTDYVLTDNGNFNLLLCHNPEFYLWGIESYPIDLVVSGHTHGGMIRLPIVGALYAPEQGWFPDYAGGFYEMEEGNLAVTRGLGSSPEFVPRVHNRPEIMIIDLI